MTGSPIVSRYRGELSPIGTLDQLEARWRNLEQETECSFFLSWSWIGAWIKLAQTKANLHLYQCYCDDTLVALAIVGSSDVTRRLLFHSRTLAVNEVVEDSLNMFIEYNGLLARKGHEPCALQQLLNDIRGADYAWDEIQLTNIPVESYQSLDLPGAGLCALDESSHAVWIAPLSAATDSEAIIAQMSKNRRWQIRRTFKEYEKEGPLCIEAAASLHQALDYFQKMGVLHTQRWQRVGLGGSFSQRSWVEFHQDLITNAYERGEIQMLRVRCGDRDIGYIYSFLWRGAVLMLQSGFATETSNVLRPGYVSHILAMQLNAQNGATQYDFMTGDSEYKKVLAIANPPLISARLQQPRLKFFIENYLMGLYRPLRRRYLGMKKNREKATLEKSAQSLVLAFGIHSLFILQNLTDCI